MSVAIWLAISRVGYLKELRSTVLILCAFISGLSLRQR